MPSKNSTCITICAQELLTAEDCERLLHCDRCAFGYAWGKAEEPSPAIARLVKKLVGEVRFAGLIYNNLSPHEQGWMCGGLLDVARELADQGYLTRYGIYESEEKKRGCVIAFWPAQIRQPKGFRVPSRIDDLTSFELAYEHGHDQPGPSC